LATPSSTDQTANLSTYTTCGFLFLGEQAGLTLAAVSLRARVVTGALVAILIAACGSAPAATPRRLAVTVTSTSESFTLDAGDYSFHVGPTAATACVYLLSLNGASPNLEIPDNNGDTSVIDDGAGSGYHLGPDPRQPGCPPTTWSVTLTPN
jgi:hypothetical protein